MCSLVDESDKTRKRNRRKIEREREKREGKEDGEVGRKEKEYLRIVGDQKKSREREHVQERQVIEIKR